ncbi:MAG: hypothetical protein ACOYMA_08515 [Bacteroidia bacterium]
MVNNITHNVLVHALKTIENKQEGSCLHTSLFITLYLHWCNDLNQPFFYTTRKIVMAQSKIKSIASFHKIISNLVEWGLIEYFPSYQPKSGTKYRIIY